MWNIFLVVAVKITILSSFWKRISYHYFFIIFLLLLLTKVISLLRLLLNSTIYSSKIKILKVSRHFGGLNKNWKLYQYEPIKNCFCLGKKYTVHTALLWIYFKYLNNVTIQSSDVNKVYKTNSKKKTMVVEFNEATAFIEFHYHRFLFFFVKFHNHRFLFFFELVLRFKS